MPTFINEAVLSLPEQVEKNKEDIKAIEETIGGIEPDLVAQVHTNTSDISAIKQEQIVQNTAINNNTLKTRNINIDGTQYSKVEIIANIASDMDIIASGLTIESTDALDVITPNTTISVANSGVVKISNDNNSNKLEYDGANGNFTINGDHVLQYSSATGSLTIDGDNVPMKMEDIKDASGNLRFVDFNGILTDRGLVLTNTYCKASLSGTHLMFVMSGVLPANADIDTYGLFATFPMPSYIYNKIFAVGGDFIELKNCTLMDVNNYADTKTFTGFLRLWGDGVLAIGKLISTTSIISNVDRAFRLQFDLLIDAN